MSAGRSSGVAVEGVETMARATGRTGWLGVLQDGGYKGWFRAREGYG